MFRNFSEALGAWSGWVIDQAAKEVIVRGGGGGAPRRQTERFATASDVGAACAPTIAVDPSTLTSTDLVLIKNADYNFYIQQDFDTSLPGVNQNITDPSIAGNNPYIISKSGPGNSLTYTINTTNKGSIGSPIFLGSRFCNRSTTSTTSSLKITANNDTESTYNIQRGDVSGNTGYLIADRDQDGTFIYPSAIPRKNMMSKVTMVAIGGYHALAVANGILYSWGSNSAGQLGVRATTATLTNDAVTVEGGLTNITQISCGNTHSLALADGKLYAWGGGANGALGNGLTTNQYAPVQITSDSTGASLNNISLIGAGSSCSFVYANNKLYSCGYNKFGQLGDGTIIDSFKFKAISNLTNVSIISVSNTYVLCVANNKLYKWGAVNVIPNPNAATSSVKEVLDTTKVVTSPIEVVTNIGTITRIESSYTDYSFILAGNKVYFMGNNRVGSVGYGEYCINYTVDVITSPVEYKGWTTSDPAILSTVSSISLGNQFIAFISNGRLYTVAIGSDGNSKGQLGRGNTTFSRDIQNINVSNSTNVICGPYSTFIIVNSDTLLTFGAQLYSVNQPPLSLTPINIYSNTIVPTPKEKSRWIFEKYDPDKCTVRKLTVDKLMGAYIRCVLDIPLLDNKQQIIIKINDKINFTYNSSSINSALKSFIIYDTTNSLAVNGYNAGSINMNITADTNAVGVKLSDLSDIKIEVIQSGTVKASVIYKNITYKLPSDTFTTSIRPVIDTTYCLSLSATVSTFAVCKTSNKNIQFNLTTAPASAGGFYAPNVDKLFSIKDTDTNNTYYLQLFTKDALTSFSTAIPTLTATSQNYIVKFDVDASGAYMFYFIPTNQTALSTATTYRHLVLRTSTISSISTATRLIPEYIYMRVVNGIPDIYTSQTSTTLYAIDAKNKFFLDDRCDTVSCSNKQASLTASYLPWNSATLPECDNCTPPTSFDPCSASGPCKTEQARRTASKLKWSSSDIDQCRACGSMLPNSYDPCNSASCTAAKRQAASSFQPYNPSTFPECADCPADTGGLPGTFDPCSASGPCKTEQARRTASNIKWSSSDIPECKACGSMLPNSWDPCNSASCIAAKDSLFKAKQPYNSTSLAECNYCPSNIGASPDSYDPCSASGDCATEKARRTASNIKWSSSDIPECKACGSMLPNSWDPCKSEECSKAKDALFMAKQPYNSTSLAECNYCPPNTGASPDSYDPCSASGDCATEKARRTASNIKWSSSDIPECKACGSMLPNSWDPCKSEQCATKKKSLMDIFMPWTQAKLTPECDYCPPGTGSLPDSYTPCGPNGQCDAAQKSRTASGRAWIGSQIPECRNCGSDQTNAQWSPPPPPPPPPAPVAAPAAAPTPAPATRTATPLIYPVVYTDGRKITPTEATQICKTVGGPTQSSVATNVQINAGTSATRKWCHDTIDLTVANGGTYAKTANQTTHCGTTYKPVAKDSTGKPIYKDVMCFGNRLPIGTVVPSPAGNLRISAMEGKDTFVGSKEAFTGTQYTPAKTPSRTMTSGGVSAGRIPLMPADMHGSTPTVSQGRAATVGYSTFTPRR